ncbi:MAG: methyltransferase domain-containing protein [Acidimicrobiia bacterium]
MQHPAPPPADRTGWQGLAEWRGDVGRRWAAASGTARRQFGWLSDATYPHCAPLAGARVLDVGCGSGDTTVELARRAGPTGSVTAVDVSEAVLHLARSGSPAADAAPIGWLCADAATHPWPDATFDVVFSRLGTMFFDEPAAAFSNLRRSTRPGGRLAFTCWPDRDRCPVLLVPLRALAGVVQLPPSAPPGSPNPFSLGDPEATAALLRTAGWGDVAVREVRAELRLPDRLDDAVQQWLGSIPVTLVAPDPDPDTRRAMAAALAAVVPADRVIVQRALLVTARA